MHDENPGAGPTDASEPEEGHDETGISQPWIRFAVTFAVLVGVLEVVYHGVALESEAFESFLSMLARAAAALLSPFYETVTINRTSLSTGDFVVAVDYGCDGIQICTLLSCAIIAFPSTLKQKLIGLVLGNLWLQAWNVVRIATLVVIGGIEREFFEPTHIYIWPTLLIAICLITWMAWAQWTLRDDERGASLA